MPPAGFEPAIPPSERAATDSSLGPHGHRGFDPQSVQPVASRCPDYVIPVHLVLVAVNIKVTVFWDVTPCSLVER